MLLWTVKGEVWGEEGHRLVCLNDCVTSKKLSPLPLQYNVSPQSGEVPKSRSLERKQQEPIVLTKWRHSTYVLDLNDKVDIK